MSWLIDRSLWLELYSSIKSMLNLSFDQDQMATDILSSILSTLPNAIDVQQLRNAINSSCVFILGPALNIEHDFRKAIELGLPDRLPTIVIDGTATFLYEKGFIPDVIVSDLDGDPNHIVYLNERGSIAIVHGHGDNIGELRMWVPRFRGSVIGSTQVEPKPYVYNFGGFTDGDRALFIAYALGVRKAIIGGMDFRGPIGRYSILYRRKDEDIKRVKLSIAIKLISILISWGMEIEALSDPGIPGVKVI